MEEENGVCLCACPTIAPPIKLDLGPNCFGRTEAEGAKLQTGLKRMKRCNEIFGGRFESL